MPSSFFGSTGTLFVSISCDLCLVKNRETGDFPERGGRGGGGGDVPPYPNSL